MNVACSADRMSGNRVLLAPVKTAYFSYAHPLRLDVLMIQLKEKTSLVLVQGWSYFG